MAIAHLKIMAAAGASSDRIALTDDDGAPEWSGAARFELAPHASLIINARIRAEPAELTELIERTVAASAQHFSLSANIRHLGCFSPARPTPRHRVAEIAV